LPRKPIVSFIKGRYFITQIRAIRHKKPIPKDSTDFPAKLSYEKAGKREDERAGSIKSYLKKIILNQKPLISP
jgi:hypothetical protein